MQTIRVIESVERVGDKVRLSGWVHSVRDMGKIVFVDLRDASGLLQVVIPAAQAPRLSSEDVVLVEGEVKPRAEKFHNPKLATGTVEVAATQITVLAAAKELPFEPSQDTSVIGEEIRLAHRYLDLRSSRMQHNLRQRHKVNRFIRDFLDAREFIEVETPLLTKGTPEGAREFIVPSRLHPGQFYVLPQSPQQFKQLLMVGGLERYYQIARCLRDEDLRGDRQPEFTQLDVEMSFVEQADVMQLNEELMGELVSTLYPDAKLARQPFPVLTYAEAMSKYGTDKPDLRKDKQDPHELAFCWIVDFPLFEINSETSKTDAVHHPFTAPHQEDLAKLDSDPTKVRAAAYDLVLNGYEIAGGSIRIHDPELQTKIFELLGLGKTEIEQRFGHLLKAFQFGAPPHGGIAYGLDRLVMILQNEPNIREVIAFPKTGEARDLMLLAPSELPPETLKQAHIKPDHKS